MERLASAAKSEYRTDRRPYQQVFNDEQRRIVEKAFAKEIELHGYRFLSPNHEWTRINTNFILSLVSICLLRRSLAKAGG